MASPSNFDFLNAEFPDFGSAAKLAERAVYPDPHASCFHCRRALELVVRWLYKVDRNLREPYDHALGALLHEPTFQNHLPEAIFQKARLIQKNGNNAVHGSRPVYQLTAQQMVEQLHHVLYWVARTYTRKGAGTLNGVVFDVTLIPFPQTKANPVDKTQLKEQEAKLEKSAKALSERDEDIEKLDKELKELREQLAEAKAANELVPDTHDYSEADTRTYIIDADLRRAGWDPEAKDVAEYEVQGMPNTKGVGYVDYVLWGQDGKPLAVVEAKRTTVDPKVGKQQAKLYADCLENMTGQRPLIFYTNGYTTWLWDDTAYPPRQVSGFFKRNELERLITRRSSLKPLDTKLLNRDIVERYYQVRAIASICEVFEKKRRKSLLIMATGTGKTRISIALVDLLQKCNWVKNVLFLADRVSLVNQATSAFKQHFPESSPVNLVTEKDKEGRVYTSTYPTMMGLIDSLKNGEARFSPGHFDLIVIDEAHRSVYQKYKAIFDYFDSFLVGLTATPREEVDKNTYELFDLEPGVPTDAYELELAVSDGFLVPPTANIIDMKFPRHGITYDDLSDDEKEEWESLDWGDQAKDKGTPRKVNASAVNKWLFNKDTADKVLKELMENGHKVEAGDRLAKTIIFARNHNHAVFIESRFDYHFPEKKGHFARIIDNYSKYPQSLIDAFSISDKDPHIAISVDMLDTGIDVPEACNLVFFKPIYSKIKFWQMIGRGTRLCPDLFGKGQDKTDFRVFDFCGNFDFFKEKPDGIAATGGESLSARIFRSRVAILASIQDELKDEQTQTFQGIRQRLRDEVLSMNMDNFQVRMKREQLEPFQVESLWEKNKLSESELAALSSEIALLPNTLESDELEARQFDSAMLSLQLAHVTGDAARFQTLKNSVLDTASKLEEKSNIPAVKLELTLIQAMQEVEFWQGVTLDMLDEVRIKLRGLIHIIDKGYQPPVYTGFKDEITDRRDGAVFETPTMTGAQYEKKVHAALASNLDRLEIKKLREGKPLTPQDLNELEKMLVAIGDDKGKELLAHLLKRTQAPNLVIFIRSCVGMDRNSAQACFSEFIEDKSLTSAQIRFIELIISHLTANGVISDEALYAAPFTNINAGGPDAIFPDAAVLDGIFGKIKELNEVAG